jgi:hypothetical protein
MKTIKNELMLFPLDATEFPCIPNTLRYFKLLHNHMHVTNTPRGRVWAGRFGQWADTPYPVRPWILVDCPNPPSGQLSAALDSPCADFAEVYSWLFLTYTDLLLA